MIVKLWELMHPAVPSLARVSMYGATALALVLGCFAPRADAADIIFEPSVLLGEEYNDNVHLQGNKDRADAFITRVAPSARLRYGTPFWDWDITYTYSYYDYYFFNKYNSAGGKEADHDQTHMLSASNHTEILKDTLFLYLSDTYSRVSQNIAIDYTQQSPSANQLDQNVFTANPFVVFHPASNARAIFGYIFQETRYRNSSDTQILIGRRDDNTGYAETAIDLSSRLTVTAGAQYLQETNNQENYRRTSVYAGPQYTYAENCFLYTRAGKQKFAFENRPDVGREYWFWDTGVNHRMSTITLALGARRFVGQDAQRAVDLQNEYTATVTKTATRYVLTIGAGLYEYRDAVIDQRIAKSEQLQGRFRYRVTPTTTGILGADFQVVTDYVLNGVTDIVLANFRLDHQLSARDTVAFEYRYANSHSYDLPSNNYYNNRYLVEYNHAF